ncbi:hypothetical protein P280DRAFT_512168 [Massarina eburnea CBS 473.64]|uniref:Uncharacterized protein n=1 Tax=Massarina eburnea CBS 473.64 TaxID=1395130 RepID=A0A6A6RI22_9PLEO|nr:hypothetical protein P280DRAFT_512168 [Massarina eburnea CBS 473.64]
MQSIFSPDNLSARLPPADREALHQLLLLKLDKVPQTLMPKLTIEDIIDTTHDHYNAKYSYNNQDKVPDAVTLAGILGFRTENILYASLKTPLIECDAEALLSYFVSNYDKDMSFNTQFRETRLRLYICLTNHARAHLTAKTAKMDLLYLWSVLEAKKDPWRYDPKDPFRTRREFIAHLKKSSEQFVVYSSYQVKRIAPKFKQYVQDLKKQFESNLRPDEKEDDYNAMKMFFVIDDDKDAGKQQAQDPSALSHDFNEPRDDGPPAVNITLDDEVDPMYPEANIKPADSSDGDGEASEMDAAKPSVKSKSHKVRKNKSAKKKANAAKIKAINTHLSLEDMAGLPTPAFPPTPAYNQVKLDGTRLEPLRTTRPILNALMREPYPGYTCSKPAEHGAVTSTNKFIKHQEATDTSLDELVAKLQATDISLLDLTSDLVSLNLTNDDEGLVSDAMTID